MKAFRAPKKTLGDMDAETAATVIAAAADVALIVNREGIIQDLAFPRTEIAAELEAPENWIGKAWVETLTEESRPKVQALIDEASSTVMTRLRQLNHYAANGAEFPVLYSVVKIKGGDRYVAVGRDLRTLATLQQRLVEAQMSMERDYSRLRHVETRYRILFQTASEPVFVVDASTDKIVEANPAATQTFGECTGRMIGGALPVELAPGSLETLRTLSLSVRGGQPVEETRIKVADTAQEFVLSTTLFRQAASAFYLIRFTPAGTAAVPPQSNVANKQLRFVRNAPDAFVTTDHSGLIVTANLAFLQMAQVMTEDQARGQPLDRWLGRSDVDTRVMIANLRQHGAVHLFASVLRGELGAVTDVEISAISMLEGDMLGFGFAIRNVGRRLDGSGSDQRFPPRSPEHLKDLIGRMPLKDIVRDTTDVIERLSIEAALEITRDNRASAAEMLGLSRQSLYVKLRRYGLADSNRDEADDG